MTSPFNRTGALVAATLVAISATSAWANCDTRHFYNNSPVQFIVSMGPGTGSCSYNSGMQDICVIPPGQSGELHYANSTASHVLGVLSGKTPEPGNISILSNDGGKIYNGSFGVDTDSCYIRHSGDTGNIAVNESAYGDIKTCGKDGWTCPR